MPNSITKLQTAGGISVSVSEELLPSDRGLDEIYARIDSHKGALFSSGFDYPGRHSRWDIGFVNPAVEFTAHASRFSFRALNQQGTALLTLIAESLKGHPHLQSLEKSADSIHGLVAPLPEFFVEEDRSRQPSVFSILRCLNQVFSSEDPAASPFGWYGAFGYDLVNQFEPLQLKHKRSENQPDCHLMLPLELIVVDRKREEAKRISFSVTTALGETGSMQGGGSELAMPPGQGTAEITSDHAEGEFAEKVKTVIEGTERGDYFEVILSQCFSTRFDKAPTDLFRQLAQVNPSPYMFLINMGSEQLVGASPEIFVRVSGKRYETCPISGTVPRGATALEDADQVLKLLSSEKEESELTMCTDDDRNDMARVCVPGSVKILGRRQLEFYSHLIHTVDHLEGTLREEFDGLDAFQTHMWACTVTGAPKPAALQTIENLENSPRAWYAGAIGFLSFKGDLNTGITLRTAHIKDGRASLRAGATLLYGSSPEGEERETRTKAAAFLAAVAQVGSPKKAPVDSRVLIKLPDKLKRKIVLVDCRDSFVHNLAAYFREIGCDVATVRSGFPMSALDELKPDMVLLSPGPGTPTEFGIPALVGELVERKIPMFGVCLGHQGIGQHFGATLGQLPTPVHGKASKVRHFSSKLFAEIEPEFEAGRYHSLYLVEKTVPAELRITASTIRVDESGQEEVIPMAVEHRTLPVAGVQFHPESLMTLKKSAGHVMLRNAVMMLT